MLALTFFTLITIFIVVKRLRPLSKNIPSNDIKDAHNNNHNHSSSLEDEPILIPTSPTKNCYVTLVQHDDEQNEYLINKKSNSLTKRLSNNNSDGDIHRFDTSSMNILCLSDEQYQALNNQKN